MQRLRERRGSARVFDGHETVRGIVKFFRPAHAFALGGLLLIPGNVVAEGALPASKCEGASKEILGSPAMRPGAPGAKPHIPEPKKLKHVRPKIPTEWPKGCKGSVTILEALVGPTGKVEQVWALRSPCKEVEQAGLEALRQWEYEPLRLEGKTLPFCITVVSTVHFR